MFEKIFGQRCHWHRPPAVSGVIGTADHKVGDFKVEFLSEYESIFKKALFNLWISVAGGIVLWKNERSKISWHSPFKIGRLCLQHSVCFVVQAKILSEINKFANIKQSEVN
jgi:hypothetical protein